MGWAGGNTAGKLRERPLCLRRRPTHLSLRPLLVGWTTVTYAQVLAAGRAAVVDSVADGNAAGVVAVCEPGPPSPSPRVTSGGGGRMRKELREGESEGDRRTAEGSERRGNDIHYLGRVSASKQRGEQLQVGGPKGRQKKKKNRRARKVAATYIAQRKKGKAHGRCSGLSHAKKSPVPGVPGKKVAFVPDAGRIGRREGLWLDWVCTP